MQHALPIFEEQHQRWTFILEAFLNNGLNIEVWDETVEKGNIWADDNNVQFFKAAI